MYHLILYEDSNKKSKLLFFTHIIFKLFYIFFFLFTSATGIEYILSE